MVAVVVAVVVVVTVVVVAVEAAVDDDDDDDGCAADSADSKRSTYLTLIGGMWLPLKSRRWMVSRSEGGGAVAC